MTELVCYVASDALGIKLGLHPEASFFAVVLPIMGIVEPVEGDLEGCYSVSWCEMNANERCMTGIGGATYPYWPVVASSTASSGPSELAKRG